MGFETNGSRANTIFWAKQFEHTLWDLKLGDPHYNQKIALLFEHTLWDLKHFPLGHFDGPIYGLNIPYGIWNQKTPRLPPNPRINVWTYPMGFETLQYLPLSLALLSVWTYPMGFETVIFGGCRGGREPVWTYPMGFETCIANTWSNRGNWVWTYPMGFETFRRRLDAKTIHGLNIPYGIWNPVLPPWQVPPFGLNIPYGIWNKKKEKDEKFPLCLNIPYGIWNVNWIISITTS